MHLEAASEDKHRIFLIYQILVQDAITSHPTNLFGHETSLVTSGDSDHLS